MKKKFSMMILMLVLIAGGLFTSAAYATTRNGVTCGLFDSIDEPGAIHWPVNGNLYYCGDTPSSDAAGSAWPGTLPKVQPSGLCAAIIHNDFAHTVEYERGLRTGTGKP
jgi:hypothetical protein